MSSEIEFEIADGVARITLNRPDMGNALTTEQRVRMLGMIDEVNESDSIRCLVVAATGRAFCTGIDLRQDRPPQQRPPGVPEKVVGDTRRAMRRGAVNLVAAILDCEKPVVAAVQGTAAGIGCHLAFACDLVVASDQAKFIEVFARRGLAADGLGTWLLPRLIGLQRAKELILLAEDLSADRAQAIGLVTRVVPHRELGEAVMELAGRLAKGPTKSHSANKWLLNRSLDLDRATMCDEEAWIVEALSATRDAREGIAAFVDRRLPDFQGF